MSLELPAPALPDWITAMLPSQMRRYQVDVNGTAMHVMEMGQGLPVVMLHGNPTWGFLYRRIAGHLQHDRLRIILPDLVGLGLSERIPLADHSLEAHAAWFGGLLDALQLEDVLFVGQDWGGPIGLIALAEREERLKGMVLLNTVVGPPKDGFRPTAFHRFSHIPGLSTLVFRGFSFPQVALHRVQGDRRSIRAKVSAAYRYPLQGLRKNAAPLALARMVPNSLDHPSVAPLRRGQALVESYRGPRAIVWGEEDPILGRLARRVQRMMGNPPTVLTKAGHFLQEEVPEVIAEAIQSVAAKKG
jgi:haloalkane dehalogenase